MASARSITAAVEIMSGEVLTIYRVTGNPRCLHLERELRSNLR